MGDDNTAGPSNRGSSSLTPSVGLMVAGKVEEDIVIGMVAGRQMENPTLHIELFAGEINGPWTKVFCQGSPVIHRINEKNVLDGMVFSLTKSNYLPGNIKKVLKSHIV